MPIAKQSRPNKPVNATILIASISADITELDNHFAFGRIGYAEYLNCKAQMEFRLKLALDGKEYWDA